MNRQEQNHAPRSPEVDNQRRGGTSPQGQPSGGAWLAPGTDPTNPYHQEAVGVNSVGQRTSERRVDEVGLTDEDRARREPTY
jgi:hypothetical protein